MTQAEAKRVFDLAGPFLPIGVQMSLQARLREMVSPSDPAEELTALKAIARDLDESLSSVLSGNDPFDHLDNLRQFHRAIAPYMEETKP